MYTSNYKSVLGHTSHGLKSVRLTCLFKLSDRSNLWSVENFGVRLLNIGLLKKKLRVKLILYNLPVIPLNNNKIMFNLI